MKYLRYIVLGLGCIVLLCWGVFFQKAIHSPIVFKHNIHYILRPHTTATAFVTDLGQQSSLQYPRVLRFFMKLHGYDRVLQAGEYLFPVGSSAVQIVMQVTQGRVLYRAFTLVDGWNCRQLLSQLAQVSGIRHTLTNVTPKELAQKLKLNLTTPEGLLLPDTYYYTKGTTDLQLLQRAQKAMQKYVHKQWPQRIKKLPYRNYYQALIVASMLEKEASVPKERPIIAAIILKRLRKWIPLQIDSTVIYGLGKNFNGNLTRKDLRHKTPYNTYVNYGLPPTPIAMPGRQAIYAALHPTHTEMMYFVAKKDGSHVFSKTLQQHNVQVAKYQLQKSDSKVD